VRQAALQLSVSEITVERLITEGRLAYVRLNRSVRVPQDAVDKLVKRSTQVGQ